MSPHELAVGEHMQHFRDFTGRDYAEIPDRDCRGMRVCVGGDGWGGTGAGRGRDHDCHLQGRHERNGGTRRVLAPRRCGHRRGDNARGNGTRGGCTGGARGHGVGRGSHL